MRALTRLWVPIMLALPGLPVARAQLLELSGGDSTLYQSSGASLKLHGTTFESGVTGGMAEGRFLMGAYARHVAESATYTAGMQNLNLSLPTDVFSGEHSLAAVGLGVESNHSSGNTRMQAFVGASSERLDSPYVQGFRQPEPTAALLLERRITPTVTLRSQTLASSNLTMLESAEWKPLPTLKLAAAAGFAGTSHYAAASIMLKRPQIDLDAAYANAGVNFHRTGSQPDLTAEFVRDNVSCTLRPAALANLTVTVARQNFLIPPTEAPAATDPTASVSTLNQVTVTERVGTAHLAGSIFRSSYLQQGDLAYALTATLPLSRRLELRGNLFASRLLYSQSSFNSSLVTTLSEKISPRLSVSETINHSGSSTTAAFGGALLSNLASISVDYQTIYLPARPQDPFQQTLLLDLQLNILGRIVIHGGTMVSPLGKLLYTADARAVQGINRGPAIRTQRTKLGSSVLHARVADNAGNPVAGAAIRIDGNLGFTDSQGDFFLRESKPKVHDYAVALDEFLDGLQYRIVARPLVLQSSREPTEAAVIVVTRTQN